MANNREYGGGVLHSNVVISLNAHDNIEITDVGDFFAVHHLILGHGVSLTEPVTFRAEDDGNSIVSEGVFENGQKLTFARSVKVLHITNKNAVNLQFECSYGSGDVDYIGVEARLDPADSKNLEEIAEHTKNQNRNLVNILATTAGTMDHTEHQNANLGTIRNSTQTTAQDVSALLNKDHIYVNKTYGDDIIIDRLKGRPQRSYFAFKLPISSLTQRLHITKIKVSYDMGNFLHGGDTKLDFTCGINIPTAPVYANSEPPNGDNTALRGICKVRGLKDKYNRPVDVLKAEPDMGFKRTRFIIDMGNTNPAVENTDTELEVNNTFAPGHQPIIAISTIFDKLTDPNLTPTLDVKLRHFELDATSQIIKGYWGNFNDVIYTDCMQNGKGLVTTLSRFFVQIQVYGYEI